jgi:type IV pilus assembly protein PilA
MLKRLRERAGSESGFTLIELLVVMLILGILAAIAIPAFLNQKDKANDASAKSMARSMQTAEETCNTDNGGTYVGCDLTALSTIEPTITASSNASPNAPTNLGAKTYKVSATSPPTTNVFYIEKLSSGVVVRSCTAPNTGGCQKSGTSATGTW